MSTPLPLAPPSEAVAVAWLLGRLPVGVATRLPRPGTWGAYSGSIQGFATVTIVGGRTTENGLRMPIVSVGTWANVPGSDQPQWGAASQLAEIVIKPCFEIIPTELVRPSAKYDYARVHSVRLNAEPRRIPDQDESMAHFETEIQLVWALA